MATINGSERTALQFTKLFESSGWKLDRVCMGVGFEGQNSKLIARPAEAV